MCTAPPTWHHDSQPLTIDRALLFPPTPTQLKAADTSVACYLPKDTTVLALEECGAGGLRQEVSGVCGMRARMVVGACGMCV